MGWIPRVTYLRSFVETDAGMNMPRSRHRLGEAPCLV